MQKSFFLGHPVYYIFFSFNSFNPSLSLFIDALRVIKKIQKKPLQAPKIKRRHFANIGLKEVFLESTPTTLIFIGMIILGYRNNSTYAEGLNYIQIGNWDFKFSPDHVIPEIIFFLTLASSMLSSAFGVAR